MTGVENLLGNVDDGSRSNLGHNDINLYLRHQLGSYGSTTIHLAMSLLDTIAQHPGNGHAGNTEALQSYLQALETLLGGNNGHAGNMSLFSINNLIVRSSRSSRNLHSHILCFLGSLTHRDRSLESITSHKACISRGQVMLSSIKAGNFLSLGNADTNSCLQSIEDDAHSHEYISSSSSYTDNLSQQHISRTAVQKTTIQREHAGQDSTCSTAGTMYGNCTDRIVNVQLLVKELNRENNENTGNQADSKGTGNADHIAASGNTHQTCKGAVHGHGNIRLAIAGPGDKHSSNSSHGRSHVGVHQNAAHRNQGIITSSTNSGSTVEAKPAEPQDKYAKTCQGQVMARNTIGSTISVVLADTRAKHISTHQGSHTAYHVNHSRTGKIMEAHICQPATAPGPMTGNRVNHQAQQCADNQISGELGTLCQSTGKNGSGGSTEHGLENQVSKGRIACILTYIPVLEEEIRRADEASNSITKHQAEAYNPEKDGTQCQIREVLHGNITGILRPGQTALDHGKTRLHKEYQTGAKDHPQGIYRRITARIVSCQGDGWHHRGHKRRRSRYRSSNAFH